MKKLGVLAAATLLALSFSALPASAQGMFGVLRVARVQAETQRIENAVTVRQEGDRNAVGVAQLGRGNVANLRQRGDDNTSTVHQNGDGNFAGVRQLGRSHDASISQSGDYNSACVLQVGRNTSAQVTQTGGQRTTLLVTPRGTRELPNASSRLCRSN